MRTNLEKRKRVVLMVVCEATGKFADGSVKFYADKEAMFADLQKTIHGKIKI